MLTDEEVEGIRQGVRDGTRGPVMLSWVEKLLQDRDERIQRDRALAAHLLAGAATTRPLPTR
jgi:hypothetical protein